MSSSRCTQSQTVRAERRNISYSDEARRRYQNNLCIFGRVGETFCCFLERGWRENYFTRFVLLKEGPREGYTWAGGRLTRKHKTSRPDDVWPDMWKFMSDAAKSKAKQKWAIEKPKLDNARQLRGIFFIEPDMGILSSLPTSMRKFERDHQSMCLASLEFWLLDHTVDLNDPTKTNLTQSLVLEFR